MINGEQKTLRDECALVALAALLTDRNGIDEHEEDSVPLHSYVRSTATASYMYADAMLEARKK